MAGPLDQRIQIIADVVNQDKVAALTSEIAKQKEEISKWNAQMKAGVMTQAHFNVNAMQAASVIKGATQDLKALNVASGSAGRGLGQLAYAIDDVQYGFNAIVNNIPQIVLGLGGTAGIAGAVGIAAVAINQLIKHWGDLTDAFAAWNASLTAQGLKTIREEAEKTTDAFEKALAARTKAQQKEAAGVAGAITEGPTQRVQAALLAAIQGDILQAVPEKAKGFVESLQGQKFLETNKTQEQLDQAARLKDQATIAGLMGGAIRGDQKSIDELKRLAGRAPAGALPPDFASDLYVASPEGQKNQRAFLMRNEALKKVQQDIATLPGQKAAKAEGQSKVDARVAADLDEIVRGHRRERLEAQERNLQKEKHRISEEEWQRTHNQPQHAQIMQSARAALDLYQTAGPDSAKAAAARAHRLQEAANKKLDEIREAIKDTRKGLVLAR